MLVNLLAVDRLQLRGCLHYTAIPQQRHILVHQIVVSGVESVRTFRQLSDLLLWHVWSVLNLLVVSLCVWLNRPLLEALP